MSCSHVPRFRFFRLRERERERDSGNFWTDIRRISGKLFTVWRIFGIISSRGRGLFTRDGAYVYGLLRAR